MSLPQLVLASASPRRLNLLAQIDIQPDRVCPADLDESPQNGELPINYVRRIAIAKAQAISRKQNELILAGDTVVACGRRILPKAETADIARACLQLLSGRQHRVYGGIALHLPNGQLRQRLVQSHVRFRRLSTLDVNKYIDSGDWQGKAGGYAIQGPAARFIRDISGSYSNIVGLSLYDVSALLDAAGWYHICHHEDKMRKLGSRKQSKGRL
mgnify:CR=1 FL=1